MGKKSKSKKKAQVVHSDEQLHAITRLGESLHPHLSDELLKPNLRAQKPANAHPTWGHCYVATEALYHAIGGEHSGFTPASGRDSFGIVHWWLEADTEDGVVRVDVTAAQYHHAGVNPPYEVGRRKGFMPNQNGTPGPSNRAQILLTKAGL